VNREPFSNLFLYFKVSNDSAAIEDVLEDGVGVLSKTFLNAEMGIVL
jgi:hypothetical protein